MNVTIDIRQLGEVSLVDVAGRITLGKNVAALRDVVRGLLSRDCMKILLHLNEVDYIDSAGIGELVSSFTAAANRGAKLKLLNPSRRVRDLLKLAKIYDVFEIHDDEESALKSFSS